MTSALKILIIVLGIMLFSGFYTINKNKQEKQIVFSAKQACEDFSLETDCLLFGYTVLDSYRSFDKQNLYLQEEN